jgi:ribosomal protein S18 acetylase RimI-like enzyme
MRGTIISGLQRRHLEESAGIMAGSEPWITLGSTRQKARHFFKRHLSSGECFVATKEKAVVGFIVFYPERGFPIGGYIKALGVHKQYRRKGIGAALMRFAERRIFRHWPNVFLLVSDFNAQAQRFYRQLGYSKVGFIPDAVIRGHGEWVYRKTKGSCGGYPSR